MRKAAAQRKSNENPNDLDSSMLISGPVAPPTLLKASRRARFTATRVGFELRWMMVSEALLIKVSAKPCRRRKKKDARRKVSGLRDGSAATTSMAAHSTQSPRVMSYGLEKQRASDMATGTASRLAMEYIATT